MRFLTRHTATPQTGPKVNEVIRAGSSETSSLMKAGIMGIENSTNISTADRADIIAVTAIILRFFFFVFINNTLSKKLQSELSTNSKNPVQTPVRDLIFHSRIQIFSHPDYTVGFGISPNQLSLTGLWIHDPITVGGEFHPAPKTTVNLTIL